MSGYLLDTNVIGEFAKPGPDEDVVAWIESRPPNDLYLASLTIGELRRGAAKLGTTARAERLDAWIDALVVEFADRVLPFDVRVAARWGRMMGEGDRRGRPLAPADAQIAAVALEHDLVPVTRNAKDFERMVPQFLNPFGRRS